ncbi:hypothetical protein [Flavobacterium chungangensis]|uniref:Uncharacterized protein n=1 Tax=Flavobacterium chungangensis TaxID=2708132 RepID=A0ABV8ZFU3_9FLAO
MQKYITTAVFSILLFTTIILTAINYHNNDVLESRINTINKYNEKTVKKDLDSEKGFKEDYYILQQSHDTNLILVVFGLVVAVIGFFTYQNVVAKFDIKSSELRNEILNYKNEIENYKKDGQIIIDELADLQREFYLQSAELNSEIAEFNLQKGDKSSFIQYRFASISKLADLCLWHINNKSEKDEIEDLEESIVGFLEILNKKVSNIENVDSENFVVIENYISNIREIKNVKIDKALSHIQVKIKENKST